MKIALAHDWLTNWAGSEQLLFYLHQIFPEAPIYTTIYNPKKVDPKKINPNLIRPSWLQSIPGAKSHHQIMVPLMPMAVKWDFSEYDLVISDSSWVMKGINAKKHIAIILTPARWLWGFGGDRRADNILAKPLKNILRKWDFQAAQKPDQLIAISKTVQERIQLIYKRDSLVVYPPAEISRFDQKEYKNMQSEDYFLTVGRLVPYKRVDLIVEAFNKTGQKLKIIGSGPELAKLREQAKNNIQFLGNLPDKARDEHYLRCRGFIFAADEDFGIVPIEAMAAGKPVIAFNKGGATETVHQDVSGILFESQNSQSLINALQKFEKTNFDSQAIKKSVLKYNPERFQQQIKNIINATL